jgi:glycosyltransferase involved in cell wall biosynthesis
MMDFSKTVPRISIVTPSYNQARYLPETIESILNQGYPDLEYVIVDGGSTDGSVEIIKRYERYLAHWVSERDSGQSEAINKGLAKCTGELFNWINSDDVLFPGSLHAIGEAFMRNPRADLIVGANARGDSQGRVIRVSSPPTRVAMSPRNWIMHISQQSAFVRMDTLRRLGGVREDLHYIMDTELYHRVFTSGGRYVRVNALVGMIREHDDAKGSAQKHRWVPERQRVFQECRTRPRLVKVARAKTRLCRVFDGSYLRSSLLLRAWRGRRPWDTCSAV